MKQAFLLEDSYNKNFAKKNHLDLNNVIDHFKFLQLNPHITANIENQIIAKKKNILNLNTKK